MSSDSQYNNDNQEIDLSQISKKIGGFFENTMIYFFKGILFLKRNMLIIGVLFILGVGMGFYIDKTSKTYDNEIIVNPNFSSNDYLYSKINLINSKIIQNDTIFLKNVVGIADPKKINKIEIKPITDIYKFIANNERNFEFVKLLAEDGDMKKIVSDELTSKNYPSHIITFTTSKMITNEKTIKPILEYLNNSSYYKLIQKISIDNLELKIASNDSILRQIDGVLNSFASKTNKSQTSEKLIYYNENTQLNDVIRTKDDFVIEQAQNRLNLINYNKIIKETSSTINVVNNSGANNKMKVILPILLIFIFVTVGFLKSFYKRQLAKSKL